MQDNTFLDRLSEVYGSGEAHSILELLREARVVVDNSIQQRLLSCEPVQYIIGEAHFAGREFLVDHSTLIPRGETEELVRLVEKSLTKDFCGTICDVGTGSGIIAITLSLELPKAEVTALDISPDALKIAQKNAQNLSANVDFRERDIFAVESLPFDIVVSNPPYVRDLERAMMHQNVLDYEPETALFVRDNDPLIFYRTILEKSQGEVFFEINQYLGNEMIALCESMGYEDTKVLNDIHDNPRLCHAKRRVK